MTTLPFPADHACGSCGGHGWRYQRRKPMRSIALAVAFGAILSAEAHGQATVFQNLALREIVALPIPGRDGVISFYIFPGSPFPFGNLGAGFDVNSVCAVGPGPNQGIWLSAGRGF